MARKLGEPTERRRENKSQQQQQQEEHPGNGRAVDLIGVERPIEVVSRRKKDPIMIYWWAVSSIRTYFWPFWRKKNSVHKKKNSVKMQCGHRKKRSQTTAGETHKNNTKSL